MPNLLTEKLRPQTLDDYVGQSHLVGPGAPIRKQLESGKISSMILWGPPGSGKTTLARLMAKYVSADFVPFSAVTGGIAEVRKIIARAESLRRDYGKDTVLFIDEIHRFNKAQQDAFLPHVEAGTVILIGATTENPGFYVIAPLLSRTRVYKLNELSDKEIGLIIERAVQSTTSKWSKEAKEFVVKLTNGDARSAISAVELVSEIVKDGKKQVKVEDLEMILQKRLAYYDKKGDNHYDTISAFIKSMRGNQPDATLHYLARMLKAGEDPMFIARRMVIFAAEDIGNARPNALVLATSCMQAVNMIGMPEATLLLAQTATYLATLPKSIASTVAIGEAMADVDINNPAPIPLHLRNAANKLMKEFGYAEGHVRYPWLEEQKTGQKVSQEYMPENLVGKKYYRPDWLE